MTHFYVWRDTFTHWQWHGSFVSWRIPIDDVPHSYTGTWHGSFVTWLIPMYDVTHSYIGSDMAHSYHDSSLCVTWHTFIHRHVTWLIRKMTHPYVWRGTFIPWQWHASCVPWPSPVYEVTHSYVNLLKHTGTHDSFLCMTWHTFIHRHVTWLIRKMTHSYVWRGTFVHWQWHCSFVSWLIPTYDVMWHIPTCITWNIPGLMAHS